MQWLACRHAQKEMDDEKSKSQSLAEMLRQLFPQWEFVAVFNKAFRCECKHLHSLVKVLRWREGGGRDFLVETHQVQEATAINRGLTRTSGEVVHPMLIVCGAASAHFVRATPPLRFFFFSRCLPWSKDALRSSQLWKRSCSCQHARISASRW